MITKPGFGCCDPGFVRVIRTDGSILFSADSAYTWYAFGSAPFVQTPIINTTDGAKMILGYNDSSTRVFALCDDLPTNNFELSPRNSSTLSNPHPNPSYEHTNVDYTLPDGINRGEIIFYNISGIEVKRFLVDRSFNQLRISTNDLPVGNYYYNLQTTQGISQTRKLITIK